MYQLCVLAEMLKTISIGTQGADILTFYMKYMLLQKSHPCVFYVL